MPAFSATELAEWSGGVWEPAGPEIIQGVSNDTRTLEQGNLYFALKGSNFDGHDFIAEAFEKGASGAVVARDYNAECRPQSAIRNPQSAIKRPLLLVDDPAKALRDIASAYRLKVDPGIVAITGSAGKSTVKEMTAQILSTNMPTARTPGNWNNDIGLPLSLLAMEQSSRIGVFEIGTNCPGEITVLCDILKPACGVVTNVGPVHIGFFDSVEAIANEKACLLKSLPADGVAVLNRDGGFFDLLRSVSPSRIITVASGGQADYVCTGRDPVKNQALIEEKSTGEKFILKMSFPGEHNVINAMLAIAVARAHGVDWEQIGAALESCAPLSMRWEEKEIKLHPNRRPGGFGGLYGAEGGIKVINDAYNANPLSMRAAIQAFDEKKVEEKKWLVLGGMLELGDKEKQEHLTLGEWIGSSETGAWSGLIVIGELGDLIARGAENAGFGKDRILRCENNREVSKVITENLTAGDAVLLKASRRMRLEEIVEKLSEA